MTITVIYNDGSEFVHPMNTDKEHGVFRAIVQARTYAFDKNVDKVLVNGRRIWV